jgi:hypothetical protein
MKRFAAQTIGIQQGSRVLFSDFADGGVMWTGQGARESRHIVRFAEAFVGVPVVSVSMTMWDMVRIPEDPATHSDNIRPPVPGYPATCDALP